MRSLFLFSFLIATSHGVCVRLSVSKLAKKGLTPSQIGVVLRDSHGIAQVKSITGQKILRLLKKSGELLFPKL